MKRPSCGGQISTPAPAALQATRRLSRMATTTTVCVAFAGRLSTAFWTHLPHARTSLLCSHQAAIARSRGRTAVLTGPTLACQQRRTLGSGSKSRTASRRRRDRTQETRRPTQRLDAAATVMAGDGEGLEASTAGQAEETKLALPFGTAYHVPVVCEEVQCAVLLLLKSLLSTIMCWHRSKYVRVLSGASSSRRARSCIVTASLYI